MRAEIFRQGQPGLTDEAFCASDVAFHRALVDGAGNPVLSYQLAGAVEAMQPLMNMITFSARSRTEIVGLHGRIADAIEARETAGAEAALRDLEVYTQELARDVMAERAEPARMTLPPAPWRDCTITLQFPDRTPMFLLSPRGLWT